MKNPRDKQPHDDTESKANFVSSDTNQTVRWIFGAFKMPKPDKAEQEWRKSTIVGREVDG